MIDNRERDLIDDMICIIQSQTANDRVTRLAAEVISVDGNFNARVALLKSQTVSPQTMSDILDFSDMMLEKAHSIAFLVLSQRCSIDYIENLLLDLRGVIATFDHKNYRQEL